jgi:hypothetical protein
MKLGGFVAGASAGLLLALLFVAGTSALGPSVLHIDLAHGNPWGYSVPSVGTPSAVAQAQTGTAPMAAAQSPSFSSLSALSSDGTGSLALLFVPVLLGLLVGGAFYLVSSRRANAE